MVDKNTHETLKLIMFKSKKFDSAALKFRANILDSNKSELFRKIVRGYIVKHKLKDGQEYR